MEGYKGEYYLTWNRLIGPKQGMFDMQAKQRPADPAVAWNASLYKGKLFNLQGYDNGQSRYGMQNITSTDYLKRCAATSYQKGQNAGGAAALQGFRELDYPAMPSLLRPHKGRYGLCDYEKVFCADLKGGDDIFTMRGIDRAAGCVVVVRPDQYVAEILPLDDHAGLAGFVAGFLLPAA